MHLPAWTPYQPHQVRLGNTAFGLPYLLTVSQHSTFNNFVNYRYPSTAGQTIPSNLGRFSTVTTSSPTQSWPLPTMALVQNNTSTRYLTQTQLHTQLRRLFPELIDFSIEVRISVSRPCIGEYHSEGTLNCHVVHSFEKISCFLRRPD